MPPKMRTSRSAPVSANNGYKSPLKKPLPQHAIPFPSDSERSSSRASSVRESEADDTDTDTLMRLQSYVELLKEGSSLFLWDNQRLQLCWFSVDDRCTRVQWAYDEDDMTTGGARFLMLDDVIEIVPSNDGQEGDVMSMRILTRTHQYQSLELVAPTALDFHVWYYGLAYLTRTREVLRNARPLKGSSRRSSLASEGWTESDRYSSNGSQTTGATGSEAWGEQSAAEMMMQQRMLLQEQKQLLLQMQHQQRLANEKVAEQQEMIRALWEENQNRRDQQDLVDELVAENRSLSEIRKQKDQAIARLLQDLKDATNADGGRRGDRASAQEVSRLRRRNKDLVRLTLLKEQCISELWQMLQNCLSAD